MSSPNSDVLLYAYEHLLEKDATQTTIDGFSSFWTNNDDDDDDDDDDNDDDDSVGCYCGTRHPIPRDNHATLWMTCNNQDTILQDLDDFFRMAKERLECTLIVVKKQHQRQRQQQQSQSPQPSASASDHIQVLKNQDDDDNNNNDNNNKSGPVLLWEGTTHGQVYPEANVGRYALFHATTEEGCELMAKCVSLSTWGYMTYLFHDRVEIDLTSGLKIVTTTGLGADNNKGLATRFQLQLNNKDVARCHLSYRDGSNDPSMGPTIERIEVAKEQRGKDFLPILWFWVHRFIQDNFITESLNVDAPVGHVMIKATKLKSNREIERKDGKSMSDNDFFYNQAGFSVRKQEDYSNIIMAINDRHCRSKRPIDEEAVLYIPLLSRDQRQQRMEAGEDFGKKFEWPKKKGARVCSTCKRRRSGLLRCRQCGKAHYCDRACQKKDWKTHKQWCGKTHDEVLAELKKMGIL